MIFPNISPKTGARMLPAMRWNRLVLLVLLAAMLPAPSQAWLQQDPSRRDERRARSSRDADRRPPGPGRRATLPPSWLLQQMVDVPADQQQQALESNPRFRELPPNRQEFLRDSLRRFQELPSDRREEMLNRMRRFRRMPPQRQRELRQRMRRFRELPREERLRIQQRFEAFRRLSPEQRERAREIYRRHWRSLPADRRRAVMQEFRRLRALPPAERERRLARPGLADRFNPQELQLLRELSTL